jgi:arginyl-tRNA synthetase
MSRTSIFKHLREQLYSAAKIAYSANSRQIADAFFDFRQSESVDISTSFAIRAAKCLNVFPYQAAHSIMCNFQWDIRFVTPDPLLKNTISNGFINFQLSSSYLFQIFDSQIEQLSHLQLDHIPSIPPFVRSTFQKLHALLHHAPGANNHKSNLLFDHLITHEEISILKIIAVSDPLDIHSIDAVIFHLRNLCSSVNVFLKNTPVFTKIEEVTYARFTLAGMAYNKLVLLCAKINS